MNENGTVLAAFEAVIALNREAGVSNESLNTLLKVVAEERGKAAFEKFCRDIMACVHGCFSHFSEVMPHLAKTRAHRDFHQARLQTIPKLWLSLTSAVGLQEMEPLNLQLVSREVFNHCMKELFATLKSSLSASRTKEVRLLADEECALRYASGFIGMKLLKQLEKAKGPKVAQFRECLSNMSKNGNDSSFYTYTKEWICAINRGGLFVVRDGTFELFKAIEVKTKEVLPQHLARSVQAGSRNELVQSIVIDEMVQTKWRSEGASIVDEEGGNELLCKIVSMWVTMRGFSITSKWMEDYKRAKNKTVKKSKNLRKELNKTTES